MQNHTPWLACRSEPQYQWIKKMSLHAHISPFTSKKIPFELGKNLGISVGSIFLISLDISGLYVADKQLNNLFINPFLSHFKTLRP
ncbi:hypothetical protein B0E43_21225 [Algoriphagus sp. A40]|nr:hypothetical protein B0E43_21225 [Algoriphagus sp. A40]